MLSGRISAVVILTVDNCVCGIPFSIKQVNISAKKFRGNAEKQTFGFSICHSSKNCTRMRKKTEIYSQPVVFINIDGMKKISTFTIFYFCIIYKTGVFRREKPGFL